MSLKVGYSYRCDVCDVWSEPVEIIVPVGVPFPNYRFPVLWGMTVCDECSPKIGEAFSEMWRKLRKEILDEIK